MTIGIFGDKPNMPTGMAVVCRNLALGLAQYERVIYFARFGQQRGFATQNALHEDAFAYELVNCEGGVWRPKTVIEAIEHYGIDYMFSEDDFFSAGGLVRAAMKTRKPLHFLTPIDSLPINPVAYRIFKECKKVYVPNSSYKLIPNGVYLPHGVNSRLFYREQLQRDPDKFTFLWVGRDEPRKAMGRAIMAFEKTSKKVDCQMIIHADWRAEMAKRTARYLRYKRYLPIILTQMEADKQDRLRQIYSTSDVLICTSKAGGFEMGITEAAACQLPTLVTDWTFMNELVVDQQTGFRIPVTSKCGDTVNTPEGRWGIPLGRVWGEISVNALASAMKYCVMNPVLVKDMGREAMEHVQKNYNWNDVAAKLYKEIVEE